MTADSVSLIQPIEGYLSARNTESDTEMIFGRFTVYGPQSQPTLDVDTFARALEAEVRWTIRDMRAFGPCAPIEEWMVACHDMPESPTGPDEFHGYRERPEIISLVRRFLPVWAS